MIDQVSGKVGITKKEVGNATMEAIQKALSKGEKVTLVVFGTFRILQRKPRRGVNPQIGKIIQIPTKKVSKSLDLFSGTVGCFNDWDAHICNGYEG